MQTLKLLEGFPLGSSGWEHNSPQTIHTIAESIKLAAEDRAMWGPGRKDARPTDVLLSKGYAEERRARIDQSRARNSATAAQNYSDGTPAEAGDPMGWFKKQGSTTHFDVVDMDGNALGCTHSLGSGFGSGITVPGTGVSLNNFINWADINPASPAAISGGMDASETDISCVSPMFVWGRDGALNYALGTPGSYGIPQTTTQLLVNVLDYEMDMQAVS